MVNKTGRILFGDAGLAVFDALTWRGGSGDTGEVGGGFWQRRRGRARREDRA